MIVLMTIRDTVSLTLLVLETLEGILKGRAI